MSTVIAVTFAACRKGECRDRGEVPLPMPKVAVIQRERNSISAKFLQCRLGGFTDDRVIILQPTITTEGNKYVETLLGRLSQVQEFLKLTAVDGSRGCLTLVKKLLG